LLGHFFPTRLSSDLGNDHIIADYYSGWGGGALYGDEGNDIIDGRPAQYGPTLYGGSGDDTLYTSTNGFSRAFGGDGNDLIYSHGETWGGTGNDTIILSFTYYTGLVRGEEGDDTITAAAQGNAISGGSGADVITGDAGNDQLGSADFSGSGPGFADDMGLEQDIIAASGGNDSISAGYGDSVDGGSGSDILRLSFGGLGSGITFSTAGIASSQPVDIGGGTIQNIETLEYLRGTEFGDNLTAATQDSLLIVDAGAGDDVITSQNSSVDVRGGTGNDRLISGAAGDLFNGGSGVDTIDYQNASASVTVNLAVGTGAGGDQLADVENVWGSSYHDSLTGNAVANLLDGGAGNDILDGGAGADMLIGGLGDDQFFVDNAGDILVEANSGGNDVAVATASYVLASGAFVETLQAAVAAGAVNLTGNEIDQTLLGNASANVLEGGGGNDTINGGDGLDTAAYATAGSFVIVDLALTGPQNTNGGGVDDLIAIENLVGSGFGDGLSGNAAANVLSGLAGNDILDGRGGNDTLLGGSGNDILDGGSGGDSMAGGAGDDTFYVDDANDILIEANGEGNDQAYILGTFTLGAGSSVEALVARDQFSAEAFAVTGNELNQEMWGNLGDNYMNGALGDDHLVGQAGNDTLLGGGGHDRLDGGTGNDILDGGDGNDYLVGGMGADNMAGGLGNDRFYVDDAADQLVELANQGDDIAFVLGTYTLAAGTSIETLYAYNQAGTEELTLTGNEFGQSLYGNLGNNYLNGGGGNDFLVGLDGNDNLLGGAGNDNMAGGTGNDVYYAGEEGDRVFENDGEGEDIVVLTASWRLTDGAYVETMSADANAGSITLTGNDLGQSLYGNDGDNVLTGNGGSDYLVGGLGNDRYYVDPSDYIGESVGGGDDTIFVTTSYALLDGNEIETLVAVNQDATTQVDFAGNEFGQSLYGNQGVNNLFGAGGDDYLVGLGGNDFLNGGSGNDNLNGGLGDDRYYVDAGDKIFEGQGEGDDLAVAFESFTLNAGAHLETLSAAEGNAAINLTGNEIGQSIYGNAGANVLNGGGGNDYLVGGAGNDRFVFTATPGNDTIGDFTSGSDKIDLTAFGITMTDVQATSANGTTTLAVDTNHDGTADFTITLLGANAPVAGDYLF
jgi:Ca2+-binding RTX toxin-like protein